MYGMYRTMKSRCHNPKFHKYASYGGRGITVCERWKTNFANFLRDMGERPNGYTIDRINLDGNYEPGNCRWVNHRENSAKKRPYPEWKTRAYAANSVLIYFNGRLKRASEWARELHIGSAILYGRLRRGWSIEKALSK